MIIHVSVWWVRGPGGAVRVRGAAGGAARAVDGAAGLGAAHHAPPAAAQTRLGLLHTQVPGEASSSYTRHRQTTLNL